MLGLEKVLKKSGNSFSKLRRSLASSHWIRFKLMVSSLLSSATSIWQKFGFLNKSKGWMNWAEVDIYRDKFYTLRVTWFSAFCIWVICFDVKACREQNLSTIKKSLFIDFSFSASCPIWGRRRNYHGLRRASCDSSDLDRQLCDWNMAGKHTHKEKDCSQITRWNG